MKMSFLVMGYDEEEGFIPPPVEVDDLDKFMRYAIDGNAHWGEQIMLLEEINGMLHKHTGWRQMEEVAKELGMTELDFDDREWPERWEPLDEDE